MIPYRHAALTSYLEFLRVATPTAAVGQVVRQGGHEAQRISVLPTVVHQLTVVDAKHRSGRVGQRTLVRAAESAHGVALTTSMQTLPHLNT